MKGIYVIKFIGSNKIYIGSSVNLEVRKKQHINSLKRNKHVNIYLQNAFNKYRLENLLFEILEYVDDESELLIREQFYLDTYKCYDRKIGYNILSIVDRPTGYKHSDISKKKMSDIKKSKHKEGLLPDNLKYVTNRGSMSIEAKNKLSKERTGSGNPMFGTKLSEERKIQNNISMNSVPKWNSGKNKNNCNKIAEISKKLKGRSVVNKKYYNLYFNNILYENKNLQEICLITGKSASTINRIKNNISKNENIKLIEL